MLLHLVVGTPNVDDQVVQGGELQSAELTLTLVLSDVLLDVLSVVLTLLLISYLLIVCS